MAKPIDHETDVRLWHCRGCGVVHMSAGGRMTNFSTREFSAFADAVAEAQYSIAAAEPFMPDRIGNRYEATETIN